MWYHIIITLSVSSMVNIEEWQLYAPAQIFVRVKWDIVCPKVQNYSYLTWLFLEVVKLNCNTYKTVLLYFLTDTCLIKWLILCTFSDFKDTNKFIKSKC